MAHFAKVENGIVTNVIVADQDVIDSGLFGAGWVQTSYNTYGGKHPKNNPLRMNFAGIGFIYDADLDVFYAPKPFPEAILNTETYLWEAPAGHSPSIGLLGKDVVWIPSSDAAVKLMLGIAKVTSKDIVYDLGSGDGKIPIAAAVLFGAKAVGIEYTQKMVDFSVEQIKSVGVNDLVKIVRGDIFTEDFYDATVVTLFLVGEINLKLRPKLLKMKPGTRIVSNQFLMGDWEPDQTVSIDNQTVHLWIVPIAKKDTL